MHEVSIMESVLEIAVARAAPRRIVRIELRIGHLSGVVREALEFAFEAMSLGTLAEGARLEVEEVAVRARCVPCDDDFEPDSLFYECPRCGTPSADVRRGRELDLVAVEVA